MNNINILLIEDDKDLTYLTIEYFKKHKYINIRKVVYNGIEAIKVLKTEKEKYNMVLLDLVMQMKDGLSVLEYMKNEDLKIKTVIQTAYGTSELISKIARLGTNYYILKPFEFEELEAKIVEVYNMSGKETISLLYEFSLETIIMHMLHELGIPSNLKGYGYLREIILLIVRDDMLKNKKLKEVYSYVADENNTTHFNVERSVRHAIEISANRSNLEFMEEIFGYSIDAMKAKPTNTEFIMTISEKIKLELKTKNIQKYEVE